MKTFINEQCIKLEENNIKLYLWLNYSWIKIYYLYYLPIVNFIYFYLYTVCPKPPLTKADQKPMDKVATNTYLLWLDLWVQFSSVQSLSRVRLFATPWIAAHQASLSITNSRSSPRLTSIESVMPSSHLILCCPFSSCPQSLPASESFPMSQLFAWGGQILELSQLSHIQEQWTQS